MPLGFGRMIGMWLRQVPVGTMRQAVRVVERHRLPVTVDELEAHFLAGGDVEGVLAAALRARKLGQADDLPGLFAADLAGHDLDTWIEAAGGRRRKRGVRS